MKKVLLIFGGNSTEHHISCLSAKAIIENIDKTKYELTICGIDKSNKWYLFNDELTYLKNNNWIKANNIHLINNIISFLKKFDVIFPITHGNNGEDGKLQGFFDLFNLKYVGTKSLGSTLAMNKHLTKIILKEYKIPQIPFIIIKYPKYSLKNIIKNLNFPLIIKPSNGGSSIGINKADNKRELKKALKKASIYDKTIVIEKFIKARELECSMIKDKKTIISSIGEIMPTNEFYDYESKYKKNSKTIIPALLPKSVKYKIKKLSLKAIKKLDIKNYARIDFLYDEKNNNLYLNEINTIPGFTKISMFAKLLNYDNINFKTIITTLIENA